MVSACCSLLTTLLMLCKLGLQLAEREALVLLTVGALPLQVNLSGSLSKDHEVMVGCCCSAVHVLVYMSDPDTPLPPRAATAARRTVLRPQALASWLAHAAAVFSRAGAISRGMQGAAAQHATRRLGAAIPVHLCRSPLSALCMSHPSCALAALACRRARVMGLHNTRLCCGS